jgi:hypothetical protein
MTLKRCHVELDLLSIYVFDGAPIKFGRTLNFYGDSYRMTQGHYEL